MRRSVRGQRRIQNPGIYLGGAFCGSCYKIKAVNYFCKTLHLDVLQGSEYASVGQRFVSI